MLNGKQHSDKHDMDSKELSDKVISRVIAVDDKEFADLSVSRLAIWFQIDRTKLSRQFKRSTSMTLEHFLFKQKMARAAFLLNADGNITVKEVSGRIGFCTSDYFIRKFREHFGVVPGRYRDLKKMRAVNFAAH